MKIFVTSERSSEQGPDSLVLSPSITSHHPLLLAPHQETCPLSLVCSTTTLHYTILHYTTLHYTTLHYTTLHCTAVHYTVLNYFVSLL